MSKRYVVRMYEGGDKPTMLQVIGEYRTKTEAKEAGAFHIRTTHGVTLAGESTFHPYDGFVVEELLPDGYFLRTWYGLAVARVKAWNGEGGTTWDIVIRKGYAKHHGYYITPQGDFLRSPNRCYV